MGRPMAANLVKAGHAVTATSRSEASRSAAKAAGVPVVDTIQELSSEVDIVITMLPNSPEVEEVLWGSSTEPQVNPGVVGRLSGGTTIIDMTTLSPSAARNFSKRAAAAGHRYIDAPVSGGEQGAIDAELSVMVGADATSVANLSPIFEAVGKTVVALGDVGSGQVVKAANQLVVAGNLQLLAEALVLIEANEVDPAAAFDVLGGGLAGSTALQRKRSALLERRFTPGFRLALHHKDLGIVADTAGEAGLSLPVTALVSQLVRTLVTQGDGDLDHSALLKLTEELNRPSVT